MTSKELDRWIKLGVLAEERSAKALEEIASVLIEISFVATWLKKRAEKFDKRENTLRKLEHERRMRAWKRASDRRRKRRSKRGARASGRKK